MSAEAIAQEQAESGPVEPAVEPATTGDHLPSRAQASGAQPEARAGRGRRRPGARRGDDPARPPRPGRRPAAAPGEAPRPGEVRTGTRVAQPPAIHAAPAAPAASAAPRRRPARPARLRHRQRGRRQRLLDQPGRPRRAARIRRDAPRHDLDRPTAPGPALRAGEDRAAEHRRRALSARRQPQAAQGDARLGHRELRQLRRRGPQLGQRPAAAARLGTQPVDRTPDRRLPQGAGGVRPSRAVDGGRRDRPGHVHAGGRVPQAARGREPARPHVGAPRELSGRAQAAGEVRVRGRRGARTRSACPSCGPSSPRPTSRPWPPSWASASSRSATSSRPSAGPSAIPATTCPSPSSRRAS